MSDEMKNCKQCVLENMRFVGISQTWFCSESVMAAESVSKNLVMMFLYFDIVHQQQACGAVVVSFMAITVGFEAP